MYDKYATLADTIHKYHFKDIYDFWHIDGLVQDCSNSIANALELM